MKNNFKAMEISEVGEVFERNIIQKDIKDLPEGDVLINVKYSSLNYKDALSASGNKGVTRNYPHTPGIDGAGIVVKSNTDKFEVGEEVLVTGYDLGMNTSGGFSEYISVPSGWVVKLPKDLSLEESMAYGTAGFTAALSVYKLINGGVKPEHGEILVTGATGGVGSVAIALLSHLGYEVIAATGKSEERDMLLSIGAKDIIDRNEINDESGRILLKSRWAGVIDTVGGNMLATSIKSAKYNGVVTCCGNVASHELIINVYPFIIRGVSLLGVDSVNCDMDTRLNVWNKLATEWKINNRVEVITLEEVSDKIDLMLKGKHKGRTIIKI